MLRKIRSLVSNSDYFGIYDNALSKKECNILIKEFEKYSPDLGQTSMGYCPEAKKCLQLDLDFDDGSVISNILFSVCVKYLDQYIKSYQCLKEIHYWKIYNEYSFQKYETEDDGYKNWHCEHCMGEPYSLRVLAWMFYLNDAKCGTEFMNYPTVSAKMGRLVIWPAGWTHLHKGVTPNRGLKYITTGWCSFYDN